jgi:hypothetical protein
MTAAAKLTKKTAAKVLARLVSESWDGRLAVGHPSLPRPSGHQLLITPQRRCGVSM